MGYAEYLLSLKDKQFEMSYCQFKQKYSNYLNFESVPQIQQFNNTIEYGETIRINMSKSMDITSKIYLYCNLPELNEITFPFFDKQYPLYVRYKKNIGYTLLKKCSIYFDNTMIQTFNDVFLNILPYIRPDKNIDYLIGNTKENLNFTTFKKQNTLYIPLPFYFEENESSLPIKSLNAIVSVELKFSKFDDLYEIGPTHFIKVNQKSCDFKQFDILIQNNIEIGIFFYFDSELNFLFYNLIGEIDFDKSVNLSQYTLEEIYFKFQHQLITDKDNSDYMMIITEDNETETNIIDHVPYFDVRFLEASLLSKSVYITNTEKEKIAINKQYYLIPYNYVFIFHEYSFIKSTFMIPVKEPIIEIFWGYYDHKKKDFLDCIEQSTLSLDKNYTIFENHSKYLTKNLIYFENDNVHNSKYIKTSNIHRYSFANNLDMKYQCTGVYNLPSDLIFELTSNLASTEGYFFFVVQCYKRLCVDDHSNFEFV